MLKLEATVLEGIESWKCFYLKHKSAQGWMNFLQKMLLRNFSNANISSRQKSRLRTKRCIFWWNSFTLQRKVIKWVEKFHDEAKLKKITWHVHGTSLNWRFAEWFRGHWIIIVSVGQVMTSSRNKEREYIFWVKKTIRIMYISKLRMLFNFKFLLATWILAVSWAEDSWEENCFLRWTCWRSFSSTSLFMMNFLNTSCKFLPLPSLLESPSQNLFHLPQPHFISQMQLFSLTWYGCGKDLLCTQALNRKTRQTMFIAFPRCHP